MSAYVSRQALKEAVGLSGASSDTVDDGLFDSVIFRASGAVDAYLERNRTGYVGFATSSNSRSAVGSNTRVYDGTGTDTLFIDDFTSVSSVSVDTVAVSSNSWRLWPYNETPKRAIIYAAPSSSTHGLTASHWTTGTANVGVAGYTGVDHVPSDVEQTTLAVAIVYWRRYQQGQPEPVVSPSGARGYVTFDPEVQAILESGLAGWVSIGVWGA
jgi:hypothetical protein